MAVPQVAGAGLHGWAIGASVFVARPFAEERAPFAEHLPDPIDAQPMRARLPWARECANVLQGAQRQRRTDARRRARVVAEPGQLDRESADVVGLATLAATHGVASIAADLGLALRRSPGLVTPGGRLTRCASILDHLLPNAPGGPVADGCHESFTAIRALARRSAACGPADGLHSCRPVESPAPRHEAGGAPATGCISGLDATAGNHAFGWAALARPCRLMPGASRACGPTRWSRRLPAGARGGAAA